MAPAGDDGSGRTADVDELEQSSIGGSDSGSTVRSAQEHYGLTSPQEQTVLERVARSRMKWRWRRLRIAIFLALMLVAEVRAAQHIFDFYMPGKMDQVGGDDTPGDPYSQKALPIGSITTPFYFYMLLALVPTDRILVRLAAIAVVVSSFVAWGMERSALHSCSSFPAYPEATVIFCHEPAQAGVGRFARWMVITGSFASVVTAALAARALLVRVERTTRGGLAVCWRSPTHIALQRLWEALVVGLLWRIAFVIRAYRPPPAHHPRTPTPHAHSRRPVYHPMLQSSKWCTLLLTACGCLLMRVQRAASSWASSAPLPSPPLATARSP